VWKTKQFNLCILSLCTLLLWYGTTVCQQKIEWFYNSVSVHWEKDTGISLKQIDEILKQEKEMFLSLVLWTPHFSQMLYGDIYPTPIEGEVLEYYGDISRFMLCQFKYGDWSKDIKGCVIDEGIAHALWGSSDVLGRLIQWNGDTWYVCGVIRGKENLAVFPAKEKNESLFHDLWLELPEKNAGSFAAEQILQKYQLPIGTITDLELFDWLSRIMVTLPIFFLWGWIIIRMLVCLWKLRHTRMLFFMSSPLLIAEIVIISWIAGFPWNVPDRFLPTRWSNSSFWSELGSQIWKGILTIFRTYPAAWERTFWSDFFLCSVLAILAVIFLWFIVKQLPLTTPKHIFCYSLIWWIGLFGVIWQNHNSLIGKTSITLWIFPTVWMVLKWLLDLHDKWLKSEKILNQRGE